MNKELFIFLCIIALVIFLYVLYRKNFKIIKVPSVCLVTGGVKTGKSKLCVNLSTKDYKRKHRVWFFKKYILHKDIEEPLYYTNVFVTFGRKKNGRYKKHKFDKNIRYITLEHFNRNYRFNYGSVIYVQECSLLADNMDFNNKERNVDLSLFNKLIAHETRGGVLYYDTQSILDSHYSIKRVCSTYLFIEKRLNFLLFDILFVREMINNENGVNAFNDDVETTMRKVLIPFWYNYKYDRYEFSYLTDDLDKLDVVEIQRNGLVSFNPLYVERSIKEKKTVIVDVPINDENKEVN